MTGFFYVSMQFVLINTLILLWPWKHSCAEVMTNPWNFVYVTNLESPDRYLPDRHTFRQT